MITVTVTESFVDVDDDNIIKSKQRVIGISKVFIISSGSGFSIHVFDHLSSFSFTCYSKKRFTKQFSKESLLKELLSDSFSALLRMGIRESLEEYSKFIMNKLINLDNKSECKPLTLVQTINYD